jgi:hypothetical protein
MTRELSTVTPAKLRRERRCLLDEWDAADSATKLLEFQERIVDQIRGAEQSIKAGRGDPDALRSHIKQLRLYADGLAWRVLHPHVIRQLSKNAGDAPSLIEQREAFDRVLLSARRRVKEDGLPVLIADITNILKIGDLIVVTHPEFPQIVECKTRLPNPKHWLQGRFGRQISRGLGTIKYLSGKSVKVHGEDHVRVMVESVHKATRSWEAMASCVDAALDHGEGFLKFSEHEFLWACRQEDLSRVVRRAGETATALASPVFIGTSLGLLNMFHGLFTPPIAWPLAPGPRFALIERELVLVHLLSGAAFAVDNGECRIRVGENQARPVSVSLGAKEYQLGVRFIYDVLYGFETVESCIRGLVTFAHELEDMHRQEDELVHGDSVPAAKPEVIYLGFQEDIDRYGIAEFQDKLIVLPEELWRRMASSEEQADEPDDSPSLFHRPLPGPRHRP